MTPDEVKQLLAKIEEVTGDGERLFLTTSNGMAAATLALLFGHIIERLDAIEEKLGEPLNMGWTDRRDVDLAQAKRIVDRGR